MMLMFRFLAWLCAGFIFVIELNPLFQKNIIFSIGSYTEVISR